MSLVAVSPYDDVKIYFGNLPFSGCLISPLLSILTTTFSKLTEGQGKIILPFAGKLHVFREMLFPPGGQVPHHYLESTELALERGVIYSGITYKKVHPGTQKHRHR